MYLAVASGIPFSEICTKPSALTATDASDPFQGFTILPDTDEDLREDDGA
jgi:hypothetical protein